jgi:Zn-dependent protease
MDMLVLGFEWYIVFLFSTVCHEAAHAFAAMRLGDRTAYYWGQVSLDPIPHMRREPVGMILLPILSFFLNKGTWMMGWASAPYDPFWAMRYPRRAALMALAGPAANLLLLIAAAIIIRIGLLIGVFTAPRSPTFTQMAVSESDGIATGVAVLVSILFSLNLILLAFNLIPLPPLDGSSIVLLVMPRDMAERYQEFARMPVAAIVGLVLAWRFFGVLFSPIRLFAVNLLYLGTGHSYVAS